MAGDNLSSSATVLTAELLCCSDVNGVLSTACSVFETQADNRHWLVELFHLGEDSRLEEVDSFRVPHIVDAGVEVCRLIDDIAFGVGACIDVHVYVVLVCQHTQFTIL